MTMNTGTLTSKGQTTVPKDIRDKMGLKPGAKLYWTYVNGHAEVRAKTGSIMDIAGMFYDPNRKPVSIEEMNEAIAEAATESGMAGLERRNDRR
jgi:AbrB family looped-hinge helix DNA binding protein